MIVFYLYCSRHAGVYTDRDILKMRRALTEKKIKYLQLHGEMMMERARRRANELLTKNRKGILWLQRLLSFLNGHFWSIAIDIINDGIVVVLALLGIKTFLSWGVTHVILRVSCWESSYTTLKYFPSDRIELCRIIIATICDRTFMQIHSFLVAEITLGENNAAVVAACASIDDYGCILRRMTSSQKYRSVRFL